MNKKALLVDIGGTLGSSGLNPIDFLSRYYEPFDRRLFEKFLYENREIKRTMTLDDVPPFMKEIVAQANKPLKAKKVVSSLKDQFDYFISKNNIKRNDASYSLDNSELLQQAMYLDGKFLPNEGAIDKINELSKEYEVAYISNLWQPYEDAFMREFESKTKGEHKCFFSHKLGVSKPNFKIFEIALNELGVEPKNVIMIGDSYQNDIAPAIELGIRTIWVVSDCEKQKPFIFNVMNGILKKPDFMLNGFSNLQTISIGYILKFGGYVNFS